MGLTKVQKANRKCSVQQKKGSNNPERDKVVSDLRDKGYTLQAIGNSLGISRERVRQILNRQKKKNTKDASFKSLASQSEDFGLYIGAPHGHYYNLNTAAAKMGIQKNELSLLCRLGLMGTKKATCGNEKEEQWFIPVTVVNYIKITGTIELQFRKNGGTPDGI